MRYIFMLITTLFFACNTKNNASTSASDTIKKDNPEPNIDQIKADSSFKGMAFIKGGVFDMGGDNDQADKDEFPKHQVKINSFFMDETEVTNAQFAAFVKATGYKTTAEKKPDWEELKKSLPPGSAKPADDKLVAASLTFKRSNTQVDLNDYQSWWSWTAGANWKQPQGPGSSIAGKENYPVTHVSWDDTQAYCKWAGKRLPTEAEYEYASRGGLVNNIYPWGNEHVSSGKPKVNSWEGIFPMSNIKTDGFERTAPVKSFAPNGYGLYDIAGNVWEWCSDLYHREYYKQVAGVLSDNPKGPTTSFDPQEPSSEKRSMRGGSFLCNDSYCSGYRSARRMKSTHDTSLEHTGFRCVKDINYTNVK